jgi:hypothetical protein
MCLRFGRVGRGLDEFDESAVELFRMHERDRVSHRTDPRHLIDQMNAFGLEMLQDRDDVADAIPNVVEAGPSLGDEFSDGRVGPGWFQELDE